MDSGCIKYKNPGEVEIYVKKPGKELRRLLREDRILMAPGFYDGIPQSGGTGRICGGYLTGAGVAGSHLGEPDIGLTNGSDVADVAGRIAVKSNIPFIADCDTGYGNELNVIRTLWDLERAGSSGGPV